MPAFEPTKQSIDKRAALLRTQYYMDLREAKEEVDFYSEARNQLISEQDLGLTPAEQEAHEKLIREEAFLAAEKLRLRQAKEEADIAEAIRRSQQDEIEKQKRIQENEQAFLTTLKISSADYEEYLKQQLAEEARILKQLAEMKAQQEKQAKLAEDQVKLIEKINKENLEIMKKEFANADKTKTARIVRDRQKEQALADELLLEEMKKMTPEEREKIQALMFEKKLAAAEEEAKEYYRKKAAEKSAKNTGSISSTTTTAKNSDLTDQVEAERQAQLAIEKAEAERQAEKNARREKELESIAEARKQLLLVAAQEEANILAAQKLAIALQEKEAEKIAEKIRKVQLAIEKEEAKKREKEAEAARKAQKEVEKLIQAKLDLAEKEHEELAKQKAAALQREAEKRALKEKAEQAHLEKLKAIEERSAKASETSVEPVRKTLLEIAEELKAQKSGKQEAEEQKAENSVIEVQQADSSVAEVQQIESPIAEMQLVKKHEADKQIVNTVDQESELLKQPAKEAKDAVLKQLQRKGKFKAYAAFYSNTTPQGLLPAGTDKVREFGENLAKQIDTMVERNRQRAERYKQQMDEVVERQKKLPAIVAITKEDSVITSTASNKQRNLAELRHTERFQAYANFYSYQTPASSSSSSKPAKVRLFGEALVKKIEEAIKENQLLREERMRVASNTGELNSSAQFQAARRRNATDPAQDTKADSSGTASKSPRQR